MVCWIGDHAGWVSPLAGSNAETRARKGGSRSRPPTTRGGWGNLNRPFCPTSLSLRHRRGPLSTDILPSPALGCSDALTSPSPGLPSSSSPSERVPAASSVRLLSLHPTLPRDSSPSDSEGRQAPRAITPPPCPAPPSIVTPTTLLPLTEKQELTSRRHVQ